MNIRKRIKDLERKGYSSRSYEEDRELAVLKAKLEIQEDLNQVKEKLMVIKPKYILIATAVSLVTLYGLSGLNTLDPGEVGLITKQFGNNRGMQEETLGSGQGGTYWVDPFYYDVDIYDMKFKQYPMLDVRVETKDGQPVELDVSFEIGLAAKQIPTLHQSVGPDWFNQIVYPAARAAIRDASSAQKSSKIYTSEGRKAVRDAIQIELEDKLENKGIKIDTNVRNLSFLNEMFVKKLEQKSIAAEQEVIERRLAVAAIETAKKMENLAEGEKQKRIKAAEAKKAEMQLEGEGSRLQKEEEAKGLLAMAQAKAEGTRLQVQAYGSGETYASVKWAESIGPDFKIYGVPTGAPGTSSIMDLNGVLNKALSGHKLMK